jgi:putative membrane protein
MMRYGSGVNWGAWMFMGLFWILLLAVILFLVVRLLPATGNAGRGQAPRETPEDILDRRFARGEIDLPTYQAQRAALAQARGKQ